ncbi:MAG: alanine--tRNA ligase [Micavibrio aeruginosavorus]|uniref:Alanine--tRNA ligase n=1 Tax=Micavibrio aeruginosavorus TaxID=349221 RepID=A0A2W5MUL0_9BACT|nr:MAG: alanine--tRNA ligase [Micavibrio aeruginosavorus]
MMKTVNDIRSEFLNFFQGKGHSHVASSPLVPQNDPTLMFANSGMVQFKNVFTGAEKRPYSRATTAQKCVRAGGKHNDLDNVGYTARHHTFFEMMGNFSFADYFKEEAISYAWELISKNFGMNQDRLLVTVHTSDEEAAALWRKIAGFPDSKIIRIPTNDNFWMMGDTGPCGPCSEIFVDQGDKLFGGPPGSKDEDGDRFLEFWNLVFMQFEQEPDGNGGYNRTPLPKPCIDTGMGLERMAAVLQGKYSNYDIEYLRNLIEQVADLTGVNPDGPQAPSHRVIADHLRCASFLLADGVMPSNEGRGYVLRRIMRRGMRHAHLLGAQDPLMYKLFPTLLGMMGEAYPELGRAQSLIVETLKNEETRFKKTLDRGLRMLDDETASLGEGQKLSGDVAFKLYDTYGFPVDLTADALRGKGLEVDMDGFESAMEAQKTLARKSWAGSGDAGTSKIWFEILNKTGPTEFLGYAKTSAEGQVLALLKDGKEVSELKEGEEGFIIVNQTPFYAESGGQVGDAGEILSAAGGAFDVADTKKQLGKLFVHVGKVAKGKIVKEEGVELRVDAVRRAAIEANHSVTHLLHEALRLTLGDHIAQKGSSQDADRTRFDISQPVQITQEQLRKIEDDVNAQIKADTEVVTRVLPLDEARESGARALFGEKYDDEVRVVSMGTPRHAGSNIAYSVELCGGTHVKRTGDIGAFKIIGEGAVSAGIRRVTALTGKRVQEYEAAQAQGTREKLEKLHAEIEKLRAEFKALGGDDSAKLPQDEEALSAHIKTLQKQISEKRRANAAQSASGDAAKDVGGVKLLAKVLPGFPAKDLKPMADDMTKTLGSGVVVLIATEEGKASIVVAVTKDLTASINAVDLVKAAAEAMGGSGGGGRPDMAQAGGPNPAAANDAVGVIEKKLVK